MDILISNLLSETIFDFGKWSNWKYALAGRDSPKLEQGEHTRSLLVSCFVSALFLLYSRLAPGLVARTVKISRQLGLTVLKQGT